MVWFVVWQAISFLILLFVTIIIHECGHYYEATRRGYESRIEIKWLRIGTLLPDIVPNSDMARISLMGILAGLAFIALVALDNTLIALMLLLVYVFGITGDIKVIISELKRKNTTIKAR